MKQVSKKQFDDFLKTIPGLVIDFNAVCEPPMITYNDFSEGKVWPQSVVAKVQCNEMYSKKEKNVYWIGE